MPPAPSSAPTLNPTNSHHPTQSPSLQWCDWAGTWDIGPYSNGKTATWTIAPDGAMAIVMYQGNPQTGSTGSMSVSSDVKCPSSPCVRFAGHYAYFGGGFMAAIVEYASINAAAHTLQVKFYGSNSAAPSTSVDGPGVRVAADPACTLAPSQATQVPAAQGGIVSVLTEIVALVCCCSFGSVFVQ
eukprot:gene5457-biopygen4219